MTDPDFGSTTAVYKRMGLAWLPYWLRGRITPTTLWLAVSMLSAGLFYVARAQIKIDSIEGLHEQRAQDHELMQKLSAQIEALNNKTDQINTHLEHNDDEIDRLRAWRDRIEGVAELPPHPRKRRQ